MVVRHLSIREKIRDVLLERIGCGDLRPGDRVVESKLAGEMNASAIPVREAIRELVAMGVLHSAPNKGAWVREVSLAETIDALQVKSVLEPLAVRSAGESLRERCVELRAAVVLIVEAARGHDFVAFQRYNQKFHRMIVEASSNVVLLKMWETLGFEIRTRAILDFLETVDPIVLAGEHVGIVDAIEGGDIEQAASLLASHSSGLVEYLRQELKTQQNQLIGANDEA